MKRNSFLALVFFMIGLTGVGVGFLFFEFDKSIGIASISIAIFHGLAGRYYIFRNTNNKEINFK